MRTDIDALGRTTVSGLPETMRAAVYRGIDDVRLERVPVPTIGDGELLVAVAVCGVCGTDLKKIHTGSHSAPRIFGHETTGTVVAVGRGVERFAIGDRVAVLHHIPCGHCHYCRKKAHAQCETYKRVGVTAGFEPAGGGFAEYVRVMDWIVAGGGVIPLPDGVSFERAAFIEPLGTCLKGVRTLDPRPDDTVLVIGQGPIGIMLALLAARTGATVVTSDVFAERIAVGAGLGLHHPIDARREDVVARVRALTEGRGADAVILAVGGTALVATAMAAARPGGRVMLFAQTQHGEVVIDPGAVCIDEKTLMGSYSSSIDCQTEAEEVVFGGGGTGLDLTRLVSHRFSLDRIGEAIAVAADPQPSSMKVMIEVADR
jgi:L-iditol 2-dehydrogenase